MALGDLTPAQQRLLTALGESGLTEDFYLSGGTALSAFYLHHRKSADIDLFTRKPIDVHRVLKFVNALSERPAHPRRIHDRLGFIIELMGESLRIEFVRYDFEPIEDPVARFGTLRVDGCRDILANKLSAMVDASEKTNQ